MIALLLGFGCGGGGEVRPPPKSPPADPTPAVRYLEGELQRDFEVSLNEAWKGLNEAIREMTVVVHGTYKDDSGAEMIGMLENREGFTIRMTPKGPGSVTVGIRIGKTGNESESRAFMEALRKRLEPPKPKTDGP